MDTVSFTSGTIPYDNTTNGTWLNTELGPTTNVTLALGLTLSTNWSDATVGLYSGRIYSAFITLSGPAFVYDERGNGYSRVVNGSIDLGAYESQADSVIAVGDPSPGQPSQVQVYDAQTGQLTLVLQPFANLHGQIRTAVGDVNGDGVPDIIAAEGAGGSPRVNVYNGLAGDLIMSFLAYAPTFKGGVYVAAGDLTGQGYATSSPARGPAEPHRSGCSAARMARSSRASPLSARASKGG